MRRVAWALMAAILAITGAQVAAARPQDRDDRGKHKGQDKHRDRDDRDEDRGDRHDNGKHKGWDNPRNPHYQDWDYDDARIKPGRRYPYGRYPDVRHKYVAVTIDYRSRHVVLYDRSTWVVADYDIPRCRDWAWDRDEVYVYDDDSHPGWYLLFNARLGRYVHVEYFGGR